MILTTSHAAAGLYGREGSPFAENADKSPAALSFNWDNTGRFPLEFARAGNLGDTTRDTPERREVLARIRNWMAESVEATPGLVASRSADLVRVREYGAAIQMVKDAMTMRKVNFECMANLAHAFAMSGEWDEALRVHESALLDHDFPEIANKAWFQRLEKDYYRRWLVLHRQAAQRPVTPSQEHAPDLFQGNVPADAIAVVQQLLLWHPYDNGLFWLLADLYAKAGQPRVAKHIYDSLASADRKHANRAVMMRERSVVSALVATLPPETEPVIPLDPPDTRPAWERLGVSTAQLILGGVAFAVLAGLLLFFQVRKLLRRRR